MNARIEALGAEHLGIAGRRQSRFALRPASRVMDAAIAEEDEGVADDCDQT